MINNTLLQWALNTSIVLVLFILLIIFYLLMKRWFQQRREQYIQSYYEKHLNSWHDYLIDGKQDVTFTTSHRRDYNNFLAIDRIFSNYVTTVKNEDVKTRISQYAETHFRKEYRAMLYDGNWGIRMNALYRIFHFNLQFLVEDVRKLLKKNRYNNIEDYTLMLKIMAKYDETLVISHLLKPKLALNEYEYKQIVFYLPKHYYMKLIPYFDEMPYTFKISLLEYFAFKPGMEEELLAFYESLLQSDDREIRIRALKAVASFGLVSDISLYESFMESPNWEERMLFTRIVTKADLQYALQQLRQLICDPSWWVRKGAAYSLFHLKSGQALLQQIIDEGKDPYAVQAAQEILKVE